MLTGHYILPNHRNIGLAPAIKKTLITYGRDHMGYKYFFTPEDKGSSSQHIDTQLGYKPVTKATRFPDIPALAPGQLPSLLKTYNVGKRQLSYLDATTPEARRALA